MEKGLLIMFTLTLIKPRRERNSFQCCPIEGERKEFAGFVSYDEAYKYLNELDKNGLWLNHHGWHFWNVKETKLTKTLTAD
jgi:hypothetical protein